MLNSLRQCPLLGSRHRQLFARQNSAAGDLCSQPVSRCLMAGHTVMSSQGVGGRGMP